MFLCHSLVAQDFPRATLHFYLAFAEITWVISANSRKLKNLKTILNVASSPMASPEPTVQGGVCPSCNTKHRSMPEFPLKRKTPDQC